MKRYFYFRPDATAANDDAQGDSLMVAVEDITGMEATGATTMDVYFRSLNNTTSGNALGGEVVIQDKVTLTVTTETQKGVMKAMVQAMNAGPHHDGITVIADDQLGVFLVPEITSCTSTVATVHTATHS